MLDTLSSVAFTAVFILLLPLHVHYSIALLVPPLLIFCLLICACLSEYREYCSFLLDCSTLICTLFLHNQSGDDLFARWQPVSKLYFSLLNILDIS